MATNVVNLSTWAAKRIIGDNKSHNPEGALLNSGANRADNSTTGDTWIFLDTLGGTSSPWGIKHAQLANQIKFIGSGTDGFWVTMNTGDTYILGKLGIGYSPETSGNTYKLYVNGTSYFNGNVTHNGIVYFANGTTYCINNSGTANLYAGTFNSTLKAVDTTDTSSAATGALQVSGGVGIAKKLYVGTHITLNGTMYFRQTRYPVDLAGYPFYNHNSSPSTTIGCELYYDAGGSNNYSNPRWVFRQHSYTSGTTTALSFYENFRLPATSAGLTASATYDILTTKATITTAQGGTGATEHTANRLVWSESATKIHAGYHYASTSKIGVNLTSEPSYNFYVNGTSYFNGNTTHNGIDYFANGTTYYINNSGTAYLNSSTILNQLLITRTTTDWKVGAELRFNTTMSSTTGYSYIASYQTPTATTYNDSLVIVATGGCFIGGGEGAETIHQNIMSGSGTEDLYLCPDGSIRIYTGADSKTQRAVIDSTPSFYPATTGTGTIGTSSYRWNGIYSTTGNFSDNVTIASGKRIGCSGGSLYIGNSGNESWVYVQDMASQSGADKWKITQAGAALFVSTVTCGGIETKGDINLYTTSADSPDITWWYADKGKEQARIWMGSGGSSKWAPFYRCYNSSGTQLYSGNLVCGDGTGASGTWGINISGTAARATADANGYNISNSYNKKYIQVIDLTGQNVNTWYPVTIPLPRDGLNRIACVTELNSGHKPSWSTHDSGYTAVVEILAVAHGWGTTGSPSICLCNDQRFINDSTKPPIGYSQFGNSSRATFWCRGGAKYRLLSDFFDTWTTYTSSTTVSSQTIAPTTTYPGISFNYSEITSNFSGNTLWGGSTLVNSNWLGFYNAQHGGTRYGYIQADANRMYFRKENGVSSYHFDFNGHLYTTGTYYSTASPGLYVTTAAGSWSYVRLHNGSNFWDIATKSNENSGCLDFRPGGSASVGPRIYSNGMLTVQSISSSDSNYSGAAMQIREQGYGGSGTDSWARAPRLAWHWSGRVAAQIGLASNGYLYTAPVTATTFYKLVYESGTWAIGISGNAATASKLTNITTTDAASSSDVKRRIWLTYTDLVTGRPAYDDSFTYQTSTATLFGGKCLDLRGSTNATMSNATTNPRIRFSESGGQAVYLAYTDYDSYRASKGLKVVDADGSDAGNVWFEVQGSCYSGGEFISVYSQGYRLINNNRGVFWHWNGSTPQFYLMFTDSGSPYGSWNSARPFYVNASTYYSYFTRAYGAVWNDYAEFRNGECTTPGRVVIEQSSGVMCLCNERLAAGAKIISDTYGFAIGETKECKTPIAVSGRVLVYPYKDRHSYPLGAAVCSAPNGTVDIMTRDEIMMYPERIIGTVSEIPEYETWHCSGSVEQGPSDEVLVNGRIWVYVR